MEVKYVELLITGKLYLMQHTSQGRIQDLSEGGGQDFLVTKKFIIRNKKSRHRKHFFDLKDSKRVKIND